MLTGRDWQLTTKRPAQCKRNVVIMFTTCINMFSPQSDEYTFQRIRAVYVLESKLIQTSFGDDVVESSSLASSTTIV